MTKATAHPPVLAAQRRLVWRQHIEAGPDDVFPLLCPVRERDWLPGWSCRMIHSRSGIAEAGAVFETSDERGRTLWVVSDYRPPRAIGFIRWQPDELLVRIDIAVAAADARASSVDIRYEITAVSGRGEPALDRWGEEEWSAMMQRWESAMNRWLAAARLA